MKGNRKRSKRMDVSMRITTRVGLIVLGLFVMVIINILASSSRQQRMAAIGKCERELEALEDALNRESTRWYEMKTPEKIDSALLRLGLSMKPPRADQNIYMQRNGQPRAGQPCLTMSRNRGSGKVVMTNGKDRRR